MTTFVFVAAERGSHAGATLCRVVGASVSGFHAWLHAIPAVPTRAEAEAERREEEVVDWEWVAALHRAPAVWRT